MHVNFRNMGEILLLTFVMVMFNPGICQTLEQSKNLTRDVLLGYDKRQRPVLDQSKPINVTVTFDIVSIQDFDEVKESFSVVGLLYLSWKDESITWNPADYGGIWSQMFSLDDVWYPILIQSNPYDSVKDIGDDWMTVRILYNGQAFFSPGAVFKSTCSVDVTYYPFDTQSCELLFIPWGFFSAEMRLIPERTDVLQSYYSPNGEWNLVSSLVEHSSADFDAISFTFVIERKPLFLVINVILPINFMAVINLLVFVLPVESGERVSYAITVLLSIAVFLTLVGDNMPKTSEPMSILCYFLMLVLVISTLMCVVTIINLRIFHKKGNAIPSWCVTVTRLLTGKTGKGCCRRGAKVEDKSGDNIVQFIGMNKDGTAKLNKAEIKKLGKQISEEYEKESHDYDEAEMTCRDVSQAVDRASLVTFSVTLTATVAAYLYILISNKTPNI